MDRFEEARHRTVRWLDRWAWTISEVWIAGVLNSWRLWLRWIVLLCRYIWHLDQLFCSPGVFLPTTDLTNRTYSPSCREVSRRRREKIVLLRFLKWIADKMPSIFVLQMYANHLVVQLREFFVCSWWKETSLALPLAASLAVRQRNNFGGDTKHSDLFNFEQSKFMWRLWK